MQIALNDCFPESPLGPRGPLPKQAEFLKGILDPKGPKYLLYCGGIGSGKTLVGCVAILTLAILYPGDYLIARQFLPQLKDTTLKTFLSICPKELILEYRVADGIIKVKASGGRTSDILFRQLEEPDKLRSLNLSGFLIDESSQVSETAFMLLQGRLRGPGLRKGFLTTNPNGHDWQYQWFVKQDMFNIASAKALYKLVKAPSTENVHLPEGYVSSLMAAWSPERIKREIEGSFDAFEGQVYHEFRRDTHVVQPFVIPKEWTKIIGIDHGYRNPACWIWGAVDYDENIYIYREFYEKEWLIEEICKGKAKENKPGAVQLMRGEKISAAFIDPSTRAVRGTSGLSDYDAYIDNLPSTFPMGLANNEKTAGIDRVKTFLKLHPTTNKPKLYIFNTCANLIDELSRYRYKELTPGQQGKTNEREEPLKVDDHACDALRYLIMSRPEPPKDQPDIWKKVPYSSLAGSIIRELQSIRKPEPTDPFSE